MRPHLTTISLFTLAALYSTGCATTTLEERYAGQSQVRKIDHPDGTASLELTGAVIHRSYLRLEKVKMRREEDNIYVIAKLTPITDDFEAKQNYREIIPITTGKERVYFGSEKKQIYGKRQKPTAIAASSRETKQKSKIEPVKPVVASAPKEKKKAQVQLARLERLMDPPKREPKLVKREPVRLKPGLETATVQKMQLKLESFTSKPVMQTARLERIQFKPVPVMPRPKVETPKVEKVQANPVTVTPKLKVDAYGTKYL